MSYFLQKQKGLILLSGITLSAMLLFNACSKKKQAPGVPDMLRTGKWKLASGTVMVRKPNGKDTTLNYLNFIPECYKDDYFSFNSATQGTKYNGTNMCNAGDPDSTVFSWTLMNNNTQISLYSGFNYIYGIVDTVQLYKFDTLSQSPLVYDTVLGALDTVAPPKTVVELDTIRTLFFSGVPAGMGPTGFAMGGFNITNAQITNFSQGSFTLHFQEISYYTDSTNWHSASYLAPLDPTGVTNPDSFAVIRPDTFNYTLTFTNF